VVYLTFECMLGNGVYIQSLTPVEPMVQKLVHNIHISWKTPTFVAKFMMLGEAIQVTHSTLTIYLN
jgi:cholesterol 7-dehydrogenase